MVKTTMPYLLTLMVLISVLWVIRPQIFIIMQPCEYVIDVAHTLKGLSSAEYDVKRQHTVVDVFCTWCKGSVTIAE